jgi:hypothetical protein
MLRLEKGLVLDVGQVLTIHMKSDIVGYTVVYEIRPEGLHGAHVTITEGSTGFIEPALLAGVLKIRDGSADTTIAIGELMKRVQVLKSQNGNWKAALPDPLQMANLVSRAERVLGSPKDFRR